jgi:type VI secretion system protein
LDDLARSKPNGSCERFDKLIRHGREVDDLAAGGGQADGAPMRLVLSETSEEAAALGASARCEFDHAGGVIGRNNACHWVLSDPSNTVSARHATIAYNGLGFVITDTSTNGTFLNTVEFPVGRGNEAILSNGDTLYIGRFTVLVEIIEERTDRRSDMPPAGRNGPRPEAALYTAPKPQMTPGRDIPIFAPPANLQRPAPVAAQPRQDIPEIPHIAERQMPVFAPAAASLSMPSRAPLPSAPPAALASFVIPDDFLSDLLGPARSTGTPVSRTIPSSGDRGLPPAPRPQNPLPPAVARGGQLGLSGGIPEDFSFDQVFEPARPLSAGGPPANGGAPELPPGPNLAMKPLMPIELPEPMAFNGSAASPLANDMTGDAGVHSKARPAPFQTKGAPLAALARTLAAEMVNLRQPGSDAPANGGAFLDPVAILRRRASAGSNGSQGAEPPPVVAGRVDTDGRSAPPALPPQRGAMPGVRPHPQNSMPLPGGRIPESGNDGMAAFWRGLGVEPALRARDMEDGILDELGAALREALGGLVTVLAARRSLKDTFRIEQTQLQGQNNNPLKFLPAGDAVIEALMAKKLAGFMPLAGAVAQGFRDVQAHEVAAIVSLQSIVRALLDQLDPAAIEERMGATRAFGRGADKAKLWDQFVSLHRTLTEKSSDMASEIVNREFARAYDEQIRAAKEDFR